MAGEGTGYGLAVDAGMIHDHLMAVAVSGSEFEKPVMAFQFAHHIFCGELRHGSRHRTVGEKICGAFRKGDNVGNVLWQALTEYPVAECVHMGFLPFVEKLLGSGTANGVQHVVLHTKRYLRENTVGKILLGLFRSVAGGHKIEFQGMRNIFPSVLFHKDSCGILVYVSVLVCHFLPPGVLMHRNSGFII